MEEQWCEVPCAQVRFLYLRRAVCVGSNPTLEGFAFSVSSTEELRHLLLTVARHWKDLEG